MGDVAVRSNAEIVEKLVLGGDLSALQPVQKVAYYNAVCDSLGLNPLTKPFDVLKLNGKEVLYAKRDATDQLRKLHGVSVTDLETKEVNGVYVVCAKGRDAAGRTDAATGAVTVKGLAGDALANALMKAETKAKRRLTLSLCGLGILDETEIDTIPSAAETRTVTERKVEYPLADDPDILRAKDDMKAIATKAGKLDEAKATYLKMLERNKDKGALLTAIGDYCALLQKEATA